MAETEKEGLPYCWNKPRGQEKDVNANDSATMNVWGVTANDPTYLAE